MSAVKKLENMDTVILEMPESLDQRSLLKLNVGANQLQLAKEIQLDFKKTTKVDKGFYQALFRFRREMLGQGKTLKSYNLITPLINQFIDDGAMSFLNLNDCPSKGGLLDVNFIQPFIDATLNVLSVQANTPAKMTTPYLKTSSSANPSIDIAGVISIVSDVFIGTIALCFPQQTFLKICSGMFGEEHTEISEQIEDAAAEILNMIFGNAKAELNKKNGYGIEKALPTVIRGTALQLNQTTGTTMVLPFSSDAGSFHIEIEVIPKGR